MDLAIDAGLAHAARDQLRHLRTEVDDEDEVMLHASPLAESAAARNGRNGPLNENGRPSFRRP